MKKKIAIWALIILCTVRKYSGKSMGLGKVEIIVNISLSFNFVLAFSGSLTTELHIRLSTRLWLYFKFRYSEPLFEYYKSQVSAQMEQTKWLKWEFPNVRFIDHCFYHANIRVTWESILSTDEIRSCATYKRFTLLPNNPK